VIGCFLPLVGGIGGNVSVIALVSEDVPYAIAVPLSAAGIAFLALIVASNDAVGKAMLGGAVIALASPWTAVWLICLFAAHRMFSFLGGYDYGASIGIGAVLLAVGFGTSLVGGFLIIRGAVAEKQDEPKEST